MNNAASAKTTHFYTLAQMSALQKRLAGFDPSSLVLGYDLGARGIHLPARGMFGNLDFVVLLIASNPDRKMKRSAIYETWGKWRGVKLKTHGRTITSKDGKWRLITVKDTWSTNNKVQAVLNSLLTTSHAHADWQAAEHFIPCAGVGMWCLSAKGWKRAEALADALGL
jgi:hypothetical protein